MPINESRMKNLHQLIFGHLIHLLVLIVEERPTDGPETDDGGAVLGDDVVDEADGEAEDDQIAQMPDQLLERVHHRVLLPLVPLVECYFFAKNIHTIICQAIY